MAINEKECTRYRAELRDRIVDKARELFSANGIKCIKMDDIASGLGISKRTLYEVFEDKETLLCECVLKNQKEMDIFFEEVIAKSQHVLEVILMGYMRSIEQFHKTNKRFFEDIKKYEKAFSLIDQRRERDFRNTVSFFLKGVEQGIFRDDVNFDIVNRLVKEQLNMLLNSDMCQEYPFLEIYESIMFTFLRGIATNKGAQELEKFIIEYRKNQSVLPTSVKQMDDFKKTNNLWVK